MPTISVIIPVYNSEKYLSECLDSVINQTFRDLEIICVDDGSTDNSSKMLDAYALVDSRIKVIHQSNSGAAIARNVGISLATGDYFSILDSDDIFDRDMLEKAYKNICDNNSDICIFRVRLMNNRTKKITSGAWALIDSMMPNSCCFSGKDVSEYAFQFCNGWTWDKLFKRTFIVENGLEFQDIRVFNDSYFVYSAVASANRISICDNVLATKRRGLKNQISSNRGKTWPDFELLISKLRDRLQNCGLWELMETTFVNYAFHLPIVLMDTTPVKAKKKVFEYCKSTYLDRYGFDSYGSERFHRSDEYWKIKKIREMNWEEYGEWAGYIAPSRISDIIFRKKRMNKIKSSTRVIISLTSHPGRIGGVGKVVKSLLNQTVSPDIIVLYLSKLQFPGLDKDLPNSIRRLEKLLTIRWVDDDLRSHKKYYYAFSEYPNDIVITVDDDEIYPSKLVETLLKCHEQYPDSICAMRVHRIKFDKYGCILPYSDWIKEDSTALMAPGMDIVPTGVSGVLYPPHCMKKEVFNKNSIKNLCLNADDLWLKAMGSLNGVTSVLAAPIGKQRAVPGSQDNALWCSNRDGGMNDVQLRNILAIFDKWSDGCPPLIDVFKAKENAKPIDLSVAFVKNGFELCSALKNAHGVELFVKENTEIIYSNEIIHVNSSSDTDFINVFLGNARGDFLIITNFEGSFSKFNYEAPLASIKSSHADYYIELSDCNNVNYLIVRRNSVLNQGLFLLPCFNPVSVLGALLCGSGLKRASGSDIYTDVVDEGKQMQSVINNSVFGYKINQFEMPISEFCPICSTYAVFENTRKRMHVKCPSCNSLVKDRAFWIFLKNCISNEEKRKIDILWISPNSFEECEMKNDLHINLQTMSLKRLTRLIDSKYNPWGPKVFDYILFKDVINQIGDKQGLFDGIFEALRPGGHLLFYEDDMQIVMLRTDGDSTIAHLYSSGFVVRHRCVRDFCPNEIIINCGLWGGMELFDCVKPK